MNHFTYLSFPFVQTCFPLWIYSQDALVYEKVKYESGVFIDLKVYHYVFP